MESMDRMLLSSWYDVHSTVPSSYVQLPENRPGKVVSSLHEPIPVIDLGERHRPHLTKQILKASQEYGFFQVINHGVSHDLMDETLNIFKEFHGMPPKEKINECSKDPNGNFKIYTSGENYKKNATHYWKDSLIHPCPPSGENFQYWPEKPSNYREIVGKYSREMNRLTLEILEILCEGLGLEPRYFCGGLCENPSLAAHHYPPCPQPSLTLGLAKHKDPTIITILLQDKEVEGLQVLKDGTWIAVAPIPNAFVVNIGLLLQIISNGRLAGVEHRAVTNSSIARTSVVYFVYPSFESNIEPAQALLKGSNTPPLYKSITCREFRANFYQKGPKVEEDLQ
ncbi:hypothetical protein V8G54_012561 [Vigna mungo]|uniref:Fe2OG dioxygenase domain-containing protein n=1 Tax=Vigna mungo TaxID=3915 RepID=A0AAQ3NTD3_VIGMU